MALAIATIGLCMSASAQAATTVGAHLNVDNAFELYVSTSDSVLGTLIGSGTSWPTTYSFSSGLTSGVTNYIHVVAHDFGAPAAFLGEFSLSNAGFSFANGTQLLLTNTSDWKQSNSGFGSGYFAPVSYGFNGVSPWGLRSGVNSGAQWLAFNGNSTSYFSTAVTAAVPEPETCVLMLAGLGLVTLVARRKAS